ncbi:OmpA family protein [Flavobacterium aquatile]|uniref:Flagellar motor protein MotB n=1 Tax=Flavobacterium aquatile LMG 4008 = ATCC 11947 TaxID=1453498 RepID=A0A095UXY7_9FLAO|nr:OmpA family protein [Flavobacterium aquatile]KGD67460.1 flagellar motor protein MotB [Flavobacterium aquatile LMG 4008 = ATCC 11947]OXA66997.1 flagellar motor protein MotB [Flavobacterium aquatile LMG 4008 = ATCC 11947]GEC79949.1 cell envelope biogenesis protein OmpA [Flavobacterium aquatile]
MKKIVILSLLLCFTSVFSQSKLKKADKLFKELAYMDAAKAYDEYLENEKKPSIQTLKHAGDAYYHIDDNRNALQWYQKLYDIQGNTMSDDYFLKYIQSMKGVMDYDKADKLTREYLTKKDDKNQIERYLYQFKYNDSLSKTKPLYALKNLDINTNKSEFGTAFYGTQIIFASTKDTTKLTTNLYKWNNQPFLNLYVGERNVNDGNIYNDNLFLKNVMTKYHEATATFSADLKTIYYTTNIVVNKKLTLDESRTNNFHIIKGQIEEGKLVKPESVFFNSKNYSNGHPSLSEDGRWLFFASDMPGGFGETDLYVVQIAEDGTMGTPQNLGPTINTLGNELFPYFKNGILYFSSDGHYGWGDLDVYQSTFLGKMKFTTPKNLGSPINSNKDDFAYIVDSTDTFGYVSSNRALGKGDDDIYYFTKTKPECNQTISGKVTNVKSKAIIADATISVYDVFGTLILTTKTNSDGTYNFIVPCNTKVKIVASKANHSNEEKQVETKNVDKDEIKDINFELSNYDDLIVNDKGQEKIAINPIFFEYDKSNITPQAAIELDKVVFVMEKFPNVKIKIESHTDSRGKDSYNMKLSDDRAKSTQTYILSKGIDASRVESAIGFGESRLTNKCSNGIKCTEEEHFKNRRSDFIIVEK